MEEKKSVVKTTKIYSMMAAVLIIAMSIGLASSCKDNKEPETRDSREIMTRWFYRVVVPDGTNYLFFLEFNKDGTYSYDTENGETINGMYRITQSEKVTSFKWINYSNEEDINPNSATLFKMLASGSNEFDQLWVYYCFTGNFLVIHSYSGSELVRISPQEYRRAL